jgi:uncharacterized phiE125 gp8 family phage protein
VALIRTTDPDTTAISVADLKLHSRISGDSEDSLLAVYIAAAEAQLQEERQLQLITATYTYTLDKWADTIALPIVPVQSVDSITYIDADGDTQTLDSGQYQTSGIGYDHYPATIKPAYGCSWPTVRDAPEAITVSFTAGYGDGADEYGDTTPADLRAALLLSAADKYEWREATSPVSATTLVAYQNLISKHGLSSIG